MRRSILPLAILGPLLLAAGTAWMALAGETRLDLVRGAGLATVGFDDRLVGRTSVARVGSQDSSIVWDWKLDPTPGNSYAGVLFERPDHKIFDGSKWDSLRITWESELGTPVRITLQTRQPGFTVADRPLSRRYLQTEAVPPRTRSARSWALSELRPPAWWFRENRQPLSESRQFLDQCIGISLENGETAQPGSGDRVRIAKLEFVKARPSNIPAFVLWGTGLLCGLAAIGLRKRARPESVPAGPSVPSLNATPLDTPPLRAEVIRTWLESHYHQPDVALEGLAKELALGPDATSKEIRKHFQDTFKGMVNRLRLQEARRLLAESDLGIAEIAFKVGYGSIPHFNRLAKEAWGRTPTEERATLRQDPAQG